MLYRFRVLKRDKLPAQETTTPRKHLYGLSKKIGPFVGGAYIGVRYLWTLAYTAFQPSTKHRNDAWLSLSQADTVLRALPKPMSTESRRKGLQQGVASNMGRLGSKGLHI